jgi:hypothetical protein
MSDPRETAPETVSGEPLDTDPVEDEPTTEKRDDDASDVGDILPDPPGDPADWSDTVTEDPERR